MIDSNPDWESDPTRINLRQYQPTPTSYSIDWISSKDSDSDSDSVEWIVIKLSSTTAEFVSFLSVDLAEEIGLAILNLVDLASTRERARASARAREAAVKEEESVFSEEGARQRFIDSLALGMLDSEPE